MTAKNKCEQAKRLELSKLYEVMSYLSMARFSLSKARKIASQLHKEGQNLNEYLESTCGGLENANDLLVDYRDDLVKHLPILPKIKPVKSRNLVDDPREVRF